MSPLSNVFLTAFGSLVLFAGLALHPSLILIGVGAFLFLVAALVRIESRGR